MVDVLVAVLVTSTVLRMVVSTVTGTVAVTVNEEVAVKVATSVTSTVIVEVSSLGSGLASGGINCLGIGLRGGYIGCGSISYANGGIFSHRGSLMSCDVEGSGSGDITGHRSYDDFCFCGGIVDSHCHCSDIGSSGGRGSGDN
jgi:hypothetical protein